MSEYSEMELYRRLVNYLSEAKNCAAGIAQHRSDTRWLSVEAGLEIMRDNVQKLAGMRSQSHADAILSISMAEQKAASQAAKQRFTERVSQAKRQFIQGN